MKNSRIAIVLLALAALTAVGFSAAGSDAKAKAADDCCSHCSTSCDGCCGK
jgi:lipopolysaccharide export system protein LptC